jgi:hypothetical protein
MDTTWDPDRGPSDDQVSDAMRILRAEYWTDVRNMAKDLARRVREKEIRRRDLSDAIHEDCDGCERAIYTWRAQLTILCSDHDSNEDREDMGSEHLTDEQRAYFCLVHDVTDQVEAELGEEEDGEEDDS